ncbi:dipeptide ABC transporter ATP-binding protein [Ewingella americana]|uniref:ABC-type dipeptide transporter n=1 Tax=Ewingella americana TaxID=41202 RepID=A0A502GCF1_9GAMM|nr:ABC transporter ATP-binding protein [Ewingella americana]TPG58373.1 ABC transporter ATP-binding protein [Ewingella americana]
MSRELFIDIRNLTVRFPSPQGLKAVVSGLNLQLQRGQSLALVGESGSGKTVTARSLIGLQDENALLTADRFMIDGRDMLQASQRDWRAIRGKQIGYVLQDALVSLDPLRRIGQQLGDALRANPRDGNTDLRQRSLQLLASVGMPEAQRRLELYPHQLSGGLRQRALIATALAGRPELLIADEPTTALDMTVQKQILDLLQRRRDDGQALLLISHDLSVVGQLADFVMVMKDGIVVEQGPAQRLLQAPEHPWTRQLLQAVLAAGETLGIVGESGSGKTTVARMVLGLTEPDSGLIQIEGQPWSRVAENQRRLRRSRIQLIAQDPLSSFDPRYTVEKIIGESLDAAGIFGAERRQRVLQLLDEVRLGASFLQRYPRELSGGQRQRVAIARAFAPNPALLVADEPVSALDVSVQAQVLDLLADMQAEHRTALLFISHDLGVIHHLADRVLVMKDGAVVESGDVGRVFTHPQHRWTQQLLDALPVLPGQAA